MKLVPVVLAAALAAPAIAQTTPAPAPQAPMAPSASAAPAAAPLPNGAITGLKAPWSRVKDIVVRAAEKMPEESYSFQPTADVRTFGQLVGHVADANFMFAAMATGEKSAPRDVEKNAKSKAELVAALKESMAACDKVFSLPDAELAKPIKLFGSDTTRFAVVGLIVGHDFEHYGNMVTYMRMKGIVPPSSEPRPAPAKTEPPAPSK